MCPQTTHQLSLFFSTKKNYIKNKIKIRWSSVGAALQLRSERVVQWLAVKLRVFPNVFLERHFVLCGVGSVACAHLTRSPLFPPRPLRKTPPSRITT